MSQTKIPGEEKESQYKEIPVSRILETRARKLRSDLKRDSWDNAPSSMIEREIALTLDRIRNARHLKGRLNDNILETECGVDTELMQMEDRTPRYSPYRFPEREKLQRRLFFLDVERRRLETVHAEKMNDLWERLLNLLHKRSLLEF